MRLVLSLPGGGIRGMIPAVYLDALEREIGAPAHQWCDLIFGTSTGGILALGLGYGIPASEIVDLYREEGARIFHRPLWHRVRTAGGLRGPRYPADGLRAALDRRFGPRVLGDTLTRVVVTAHRKPSGAMVDGGVHANDPADCALTQALRLWPGEPITLLSVGNAPRDEHSRAVFWKSWEVGHGGRRAQDCAYATSSAPTYFPPQAMDGSDTRETGWGLLDWGGASVGMFMEGAAGVVEYRTREIADLLGRLIPGSAYLDVRPYRTTGPMDDASPENLRRLHAAGLEMVHAHRSTTDRVRFAVGRRA